jgi:hypothetical protein
MRKKTMYGAAKFAALLACAVMLAWPVRPQGQFATGGSNMMLKHFYPAFDELFPIKHAEGDFIAVRAHREFSYNLLEFSVVIENTENSKMMRGILREAEGESLYQQVHELVSKDLDVSLEQMKPELKVQMWSFSAAQCPAVAEQYKAFENITFVRPRDDDAQDEHPIMYQFHESVGGGDSEVMEYVESRAFPKWANATHRAFAACATSSPATKNE